jgi:hypothetical protein
LVQVQSAVYRLHLHHSCTGVQPPIFQTMKLAPPNEQEISAMLAVIPSRPEYQTWLKICSAVFSVLPLEQGCRVLNAWSPEERAGEYAGKHRGRCEKIGIGSLIRIAREHGYRGNADRWQGTIKISKALPLPKNRTPLYSSRKKAKPNPTGKNQHTEVRDQNDPQPKNDKTAEVIAKETNDTEAHRIAAELMKAHRLGMIDGPRDPMARTLAAAIRIFDGTIVEDY